MTNATFQQTATASALNKSDFNNERQQAADIAFVNYNFGFAVEDSGGWEFTSSGNEWTQIVYWASDEGDGEVFGTSKKCTFVIRFKPTTTEIAEVYAIDLKGQFIGSQPPKAEVPKDEMVLVDIKTVDGVALDWLVAKAMKVKVVIDTESIPRLLDATDNSYINNADALEYSPSTDPLLAYPIMWSNQIDICHSDFDVAARVFSINSGGDFKLLHECRGSSPLIAAMRAFVMLKLDYCEKFHVPAVLFTGVTLG